jgi:hypothetical protein
LGVPAEEVSEVVASEVASEVAALEGVAPAAAGDANTL